MKRNLLLASLALTALVSCQKHSTVESTLTTNQTMKYAPYAGAGATKGTPVNSNTIFKESNSGSFKVAAYSGSESYFNFSNVSWDETNSKWANGAEMYWPNADATLNFGAYYPASASVGTYADALSYSHNGTDHTLKFGYKVGNILDRQVDLMYALSDHEYKAPISTNGGLNLGEDGEATEYNKTIALNFKHALTQIAFAATKDASLDVKVKGITLCNIVDNGIFTATKSTEDIGAVDGTIGSSNVERNNLGSWEAASPTANPATNLAVYKTALAFDKDDSNNDLDYVEVGDSKTTLTKSDDVLMLIPQELANPWDPKVAANNDGTNSYLAIDCVITHADNTAAIINGRIYVPFDSKQITYNLSKGDGTWLPGYKITYNLKFGGGYTKPGETTDTDPIPGKTPEPDDVLPTLRPITYSVTVDEWVPGSGGNVSTGGEQQTV